MIGDFVDFVMFKIVMPILVLVFIGAVAVTGMHAYAKPQCLEKGYARTEVSIGLTAYCTKRVNGTDIVEKL